MRTIAGYFCLLALLSALWPAAHAASEIVVEGLMPNAAVINVNGQRKMVRVGKSFSGVRLLSVGPSSVTLEFEGKRMNVGLNRQVGTSYEAAEEVIVTIPRDKAMQYITSAEINGRRAVVLVDTGATSVAMSEAHANSMGIDYFNGVPIRTRTASGDVPARLVTLHSVNVGGIEVSNVEGVVVPGGYPRTILLGMSFLQHVTIKDENGLLTLTQSR